MAPDLTSPETDSGAVVAHGLLTSMAVVHAGVVTVWEHWADLPAEKRDHIFERILAHTAFVTETLRDLTRGLPEGVVAELEAMQRRRPLPPGVMRSSGHVDLT
jgi:hypothetical protein